MLLYPGYGNDSPDMGNFHAWGHFSQILWSTTNKVGCYTHSCIPEGAKALDCPQGTGESYLPPLECAQRIPAIFTVCNYSPPGMCHYHQICFYIADHTDRKLRWSVLQSQSAFRRQGHSHDHSRGCHRHVKHGRNLGMKP